LIFYFCQAKKKLESAATLSFYCDIARNYQTNLESFVSFGGLPIDLLAWFYGKSKTLAVGFLVCA
jgi:hypothetical protein